MHSIRYPSLDEFWPAIRVRNFVKALGFPATNYAENMAFLAARAGVHVKQMNMVNPLTFAERNNIDIVSILGSREGFMLDVERDPQRPRGSGTWAYAKRQPIPPYVAPSFDKWAITKAVIGCFLKKFKEATNEAERIATMGRIFTYILSIEAFLRAHPTFFAMIVAKVAEIKAEPLAESIMSVILKVETFLEGLHVEQKPPPLKLLHLPVHELHAGEMAPLPSSIGITVTDTGTH